LLTPAAVMSLVLGMWRVAADLEWTSSFAISSGLFSHWQVWFAGAVVLEIGSRLLVRYGSQGADLPRRVAETVQQEDAGTRVV
jgi:hypothetical protein